MLRECKNDILGKELAVENKNEKNIIIENIVYSVVACVRIGK